MSLDRLALVRAVADHGAVARVVICRQRGSAPRAAGTAMLVWADGQSGTIGGGALELDATTRARALLAGPPAAFLRATLDRPLGPALGQCCGGHVQLLVERLTQTELAAIPDAGHYARPIRTGPWAEPPLAAAAVLRQVRSGQIAGPALAQGWFIEPVGRADTPVWIWGAGHVGRALTATLAGLPFAVTWIDDARARFPDIIPPHADMLVAADLPAAAAHAPAGAHHFVLTYSHPLDLAICHALLSRRFAFLGLIGSATKKARFLNRLRALGHPPERLARLTCPIGDPELGKHPQAIAVSVVNALLKGQTAARESGTSDREQTV